MTIKEFRKKMNESLFANDFKQIEVNINYPHLKYENKLLGLDSIYSFIQRQNKGWKNKDLPAMLKASQEYFKRLSSQIQDLLNVNHTSYNMAVKIPQLKTELQRTKINNYHIFIPGASETQFLISLYKENENYLKGAYDFLCNNALSINSNNYLIGFLKAYEFRFQEQSNIVKRRNNEKVAISTIRNEFENYISNFENEFSELIDKSKEEFETQKNKIDNEITDIKQKFGDWHKSMIKENLSFIEEKNNKLNKLEETYLKKLQLEAPAKYWNKKSLKYREDADKAKKILIWIVSIFSVFLITLLLVAPDWIFKTIFNENKIAVIRWSILFITLLSLLAYIIRALTKIMFSSFHLARDAEERHTLTYFYLSLLKDSKINEEDRKLIIQALFSRSDTGLLKGDNELKMPNDYMNKLINRNS